MAVPSRSATLDRWLESLGRRSSRSSSRRSRLDLGDFARRAPSLDHDEGSVYDALVRRFLRPRLIAFAGTGLVLGIDAEPGWRDVLPAAADVTVLPGTESFGTELEAVASVDWVLIDRRVQRLADPSLALSQVAGRLKPGTTLITLCTGIARAEPDECRPLWTVAPYAARRMHEECGQLERIEVEHYGNVALALAWLYRLPAHELSEGELAAVDPAYPVLVAVTASKRGARR